MPAQTENPWRQLRQVDRLGNRLFFTFSDLDGSGQPFSITQVGCIVQLRTQPAQTLNENGILEHRSELQLGVASIGFNFRDQRREGAHQGLIVSHCDNCHIYSQSHKLDEETSDATIDAKVAWKGGYVKGSFTSRSLEHGTPSVPVQFDDALHPENQVPIFDNRLQYDSAEGPQIADLWADMDKDKVRLDLHLNDVAGFGVNAGGVWAGRIAELAGVTTVKVTASNCGSEAFQKKLYRVMTSAMDQKPSAQYMPAKVITDTIAARRTKRIRCPKWSLNQPQRLGATTLVAIRMAISSPMATASKPACWSRQAPSANFSIRS